MRMKLLCCQCEKLRLLEHIVGGMSRVSRQHSLFNRASYPNVVGKVPDLRQSRRPSRNLTDDNMVGMDRNNFMSSAQILWDYLRIDHALKKSDLILVLGNSDLRTADYAATLYHEGYAPLLVVSGKEGHRTKGRWKKPEAVVFADKLMRNNVPSESILLEPEATNTGENIRFTQKLLHDHDDPLQPQSIILVQTPFMGRRCLATFQKQWENAEHVSVMVSSPPIPLEEYPSREAGYDSLRDVVVEMVRNMQRIERYPSQGFQVPQHVPSHVSEAFRHLQSVIEDEKL